MSAAEAGPAFTKPFAARGLAVGDYDNDGFLDVLVAPTAEHPLLLRNQLRPGKPLAGVKLEGVKLQSRRYRGAAYVVRRRGEADPAEE